MLQPLQLLEVSDRYPDEIAELRDFLLKAGAVPSTERSLPEIVHRLHRDRAFHRDLTSHLWVVIHLAQRAISYADLLGILAIAISGPSFAARADEDDAHALLRFVMDARRALDHDVARDVAHNLAPDVDPTPPRQIPPGPTLLTFAAPAQILAPPPQPTQQAIPHIEETWQTRLSPTHFSALDHEDPVRSRKPFFWLLATCALLALSAGAYLHIRNLADQPAPPVPEAAPAVVANEATPTPTPTPPTALPEAPTHPTAPVKGATHHIPAHEHSARIHPPTPPQSHPQSRTHATILTTPPPPPAPTVATRSPNLQPPASRPNPAPSSSASAPRPIPQTASEPDRTNISRTYEPPHLVRRTPEQRAELNPGSLNTTVHATTLGAGASTVIYSPVPAYPPAAASAHVQGEVKVEASVDRLGNVSSVRVISGPPMLRAAALDAAQRWRFRPTSETGETSTSAITVFAFQLP